MTSVVEYQVGESVRLSNAYTDSDGVAFDPDTIEIKIYNPLGTLKTTVTYAAGTITRGSAGNYHYDYSIPSDGDIGLWTARWTAMSGTQSVIDPSEFIAVPIDDKLYCTPELVYSRCGMGSEIATRAETTVFIRDAMDEIDSMMGRSFQYEQDKEEWFDTDFPDTLMTANSVFLNHRPVLEIVSVMEYDCDNIFKKEYIINDDDIWIASTGYSAGDIVISSLNTAYAYECTVAGTSDTSEPTWPIVNDEVVVDGTVTFKCVTRKHEYWIDLGTGMIKLTSGEFVQQRRRVRVIYKSGYCKIPRKISKLCAIMAGQNVLNKFIGKVYDDPTSYSLAGLSVSIGEPYSSAARAMEMLEKEKNKLIANIGRLRPSIIIL